MTVRLMAITQPWLSEAGKSPEELMAYFARVSNTANQSKHETGPKLMASLRRRQEWSPFEMVDAIFEIITTRDIARQMLRHRSFSFQEFSQRYAEVKDFVDEGRQARLQDPADRQNSLADGVPADVVSGWQWHQANALEAARAAYNYAIDNGLAKEVARVVLPEGLTISRLYMKGSIRSWIHYVDLRAKKKGAQLEHQLIAAKIGVILTEVLPMVFAG